MKVKSGTEMTANDVESSTREETVTKAVYRFKIWNELENRDLVKFPRPCKGRVPNFLDCKIAAEKLSSLDCFKEAQVILVNIDIPQLPVRMAVLEAGKTLLVPARHEDGILTQICPPTNPDKYTLKRACSSRNGVQHFGKPIGLYEKIHIDMIVLGSVAVSKEGHQIGKGGGFADLEFAMLTSTGAVTDSTLIVTTVHDEQIFDNLPSEMFKPFDVPVNLIVSPTKVVEVRPCLPRPEGILWDFVSNRRLENIPPLKTFRTKEVENGNQCDLKEVDSDAEDRPKPYYKPSFRSYRPRSQQPRSQQEPRDHSRGRSTTPREPGHHTVFYRRRQPKVKPDDSATTKEQEEHKATKRDQAEDTKINKENQENLRRKTFRRNLDKSEDKKIDDENKENLRQKPNRRNFDKAEDKKVDKENIENFHRRPFRRNFFRNKIPTDFSVKVGNIAKTVRVRDLKAALVEKGVRPRYITWKGPRGFALLHFAQMKAQQEEPTSVDDVIASLQGLKVKFETTAEAKEALLSVEPAKPISRIENAGVTSV